MEKDSESIIRKENPELHKAIVKRIGSAPDPRPLTVRAAYNEKWTVNVAWDRLLHELTSISVNAEDASMLQAIQDNVLGTMRNLKTTLTDWVANYPMLTWTLSITNAKARRYIAVAIGDESMISTIAAKHITPELIDHIRDNKTARSLRWTKGSDGCVSETFGTLKSAIRREKFGRVWWIVSSINLKDLNTDDINKELEYVFSHHEDDEVLWPLLENGELPAESFRVRVIEDPSPPSSKSYQRLLRYVWDVYLKNTASDDENGGNPIGRFMHRVWLNSVAYPYVDESFAQYMVKTYLDSSGNTQFDLYTFLHPMYATLWRLLIPYLPSIAKKNVTYTGIVAILAHENDLKDIAKEYANAFVKYYDASEPNYIIVRDVGRMHGFDWLYDQLTPEQQEAMFWGVDYDEKEETSERDDTQRSYYGALLPPRYYDALLKDFEQTKKMVSTLTRVVAENLKDSHPDIAIIGNIIHRIDKIHYMSIFLDVRKHKTAGALFLTLIPKETVNADYWIIGRSHETSRALLSIIGYPTMKEFMYIFRKNIELVDYGLLDVLPHDKLVEYADAGGFANLSPYDKLQIAKKYNIKSSKMFDAKFVYKFFHKELPKLTMSTIKEVFDVLPDTTPWSELLMHPNVYDHPEAEQIITLLLQHGADPSYRHSYALIRELAIRKRPAILRLLATPKSLENLHPAMVKDIETLIKND